MRFWGLWRFSRNVESVSYAPSTGGRSSTPPASTIFSSVDLGERLTDRRSLGPRLGCGCEDRVSVVFWGVGWLRWARRFSAARISLNNVRLELGADDCFQALTWISNILAVD
jgi:hypothetical protein